MIGYNVLDFTSEMDYKDTRLDKGRKHKVNDTNIQDNWTSQDKYNGWHYKMVQYKWTRKQKQLLEQFVNMWICVELYAILDVVISLISVNNELIQIIESVSVTGEIASLQYM